MPAKLKRKPRPKKKGPVLIDVNTNMTLEVSRDEWESFKETAQEEGTEAAFEAAQWHLDGEELPTVGGRAWICSIDSASVIEGD